MNIGIFSGSFNPIHIGHLALANWMCEYGGMDEVWLLVTPQNPLKAAGELMDYDRRLEMTRLAASDYPKFRVSDFERTLDPPYYTLDTLRALRRLHPTHRLHLLIGADSWQTFDRWKEADALAAEFPILIYPRHGFDRPAPPDCPNIRRVDAPLLEISSTFIRRSWHEGHDVRFFLPEPIRRFAPPKSKNNG